jgi:nicotinamidase-related amidase
MVVLADERAAVLVVNVQNDFCHEVRADNLHCHSARAMDQFTRLVDARPT